MFDEAKFEQIFIEEQDATEQLPIKAQVLCNPYINDDVSELQEQIDSMRRFREEFGIRRVGDMERREKRIMQDVIARRIYEQSRGDAMMPAIAASIKRMARGES